MARPQGAKNIIPSQSDQKQMLRDLRRKAEAGDTTAAAVLLLVAERHREISRHG